ncbi:glycosyltransferase family 4 protein [Maritimibacter sp. DP1N21-5]|uniref:glycosyltransferase family 4 protein n=1 Tax=Maritimibacter sp. DP1N21-5 TaxID=2836867 RepID=UPI001C457CD3|nr:glycosyltransferase family 4 protein [Maritimibacter sp. DP1N21-5]MBV7410710.1 glycosyltransferase family 4 protein [Maritimibacter sp. DP1N21-5]
MARWFYRSCHIIVPSEHLRMPLAPYARSVQVCENFYAGSVGSIGEGSKVAPDVLTVLWNSNIIASKGFFEVFASVQDLRACHLPVNLVSLGALVADEELVSEALKQRFSDLGVPAWFDYRGPQSHARTVELLEQADVVCLPSRYNSECQPVAIIEAMCAGKAIVASEIPALRSTLADYPAEFVPVHSVDAISSALCALAREKARDPDGFDGARAQFAADARKRFAKARFDFEMKAVLAPTSVPDT